MSSLPTNVNFKNKSLHKLLRYISTKPFIPKRYSLHRHYPMPLVSVSICSNSRSAPLSLFSVRNDWEDHLTRGKPKEGHSPALSYNVSIKESRSPTAEEAKEAQVAAIEAATKCLIGLSVIEQWLHLLVIQESTSTSKNSKIKFNLTNRNAQFLRASKWQVLWK